MDWPFDQLPAVEARTTVGVLEGRLPILVVRHFDHDGSWAFLCGTTCYLDDSRVISMGNALRLDPSLRSIAHLPPGWDATRETVGGEWTIELCRGFP
jgi:hypothetical protein